jgi:hypothetical protein
MAAQRRWAYTLVGLRCHEMRKGKKMTQKKIT